MGECGKCHKRAKTLYGNKALGMFVCWDCDEKQQKEEESSSKN